MNKAQQQARIAELEAQLAAEQEKTKRLQEKQELPKPGFGFTSVSKKSDNPKAPQRWGMITTPDGKTYRLSIWQYVSGTQNIRESIELAPLDRAAENTDKVQEVASRVVYDLMEEEPQRSAH